MSAGTISIQNNAAAVAGDGTAFTTELSAGDFIVITTGGVTYTLPVKSIESDTALTLARNYNGPAVTGAAWTAMPRDTLNRISAQIAADKRRAKCFGVTFGSPGKRRRAYIIRPFKRSHKDS